MAEQIICALNDLAKQNKHKDKPHFERQFEHQFATSIGNIIAKKGSGSTQRRKRRAVRVLCSIRSQINEAVLVCCVSSVGYTVLADVNNIDDTIEKLLSWWTEVKDVDHLSQYANELFHKNFETIIDLLGQGGTSQTQQKELQVTSCGTAPAPSELTEGHDSSNSNTSVVTSQMQQEERQVISRNDAPAPLEFTGGLKGSNSNTPIVTSQVRHEEGPVISHHNPPELIGGLEGLSSGTQGIDFVPEGFAVPWPKLLSIFARLEHDGATARFFILDSTIYITVESENVGIIQMSPYLSNFTINALCEATKTSC